MRALLVSFLVILCVPLAQAVPIPNWEGWLGEADHGVAYQGSRDDSFLWLHHGIICGGESTLTWVLRVESGSPGDVLQLSAPEGSTWVSANATPGHPARVTVAQCSPQFAVVGLSVATAATYSVKLIQAGSP